MANDSIMVVNDYGLTRRTPQLKSGKAGKARYTISIRSEPLLIQTDPKALGAGPAQAIADHLKQRVGDISTPAAPATIRARLAAQKALIQGAPWAQKRYSGGRMGTRPPARSDNLFNDSGRLRESIAVRAASGNKYVINVAGNRFDPSTFNGGEAAMAQMIERLRELVPEWGDARELANVLSVRRAIQDGLGDALKKANERTVELQKQLMRQTFGKLLQFIARAA